MIVGGSVGVTRKLPFRPTFSVRFERLEGPRMQVPGDFAFRSVVSLASISLGITSYLMQQKLEEIASDTKALSGNYYQLRVEGATDDALMNSMRTRLEICESNVQKIQERLYNIDLKINRK